MTAKMLTTEQVADEIHTTPVMVCRMIRRGDLTPAVKTEKRWLVPETTLRKYLAARMVGEAS